MKVKIDKVGRMYFPKTLIDILKIELPTELEVYYNSNNHSIIISPDSMFSIKHEIKKQDFTSYLKVYFLLSCLTMTLILKG